MSRKRGLKQLMTGKIASSVIFIIRVLGSTNGARPSRVGVHGVLRINHVGVKIRIAALSGVSRDVWKDEYLIGVDVVDVTEKIKQIGLEILGVDLWEVKYNEPFITSIHGPK